MWPDAGAAWGGTAQRPYWQGAPGWGFSGVQAPRRPRLALIREQRLRNFRFGLMNYRNAINQRLDALDAFAARELDEPAPAPPSDTTGYDTTVDSGGGTSAPVVVPSHRLLYDVFDELESDDFTDEGYPRVSAVNRILEDRGRSRTDKATIDAAYDSYVHERSSRDVGYSAPEVPTSTTPTLQLIQETFSKLDPDDDFTEDGNPRAAAVNDLLEDRGLGRATASQIHSAYDKWKKQQVKEIQKTFASLKKDDFTEDGYPRVAAVNREIEPSYGPATASEIHAAYDKWKKEEG
jgi:hypothetical protein